MNKTIKFNKDNISTTSADEAKQALSLLYEKGIVLKESASQVLKVSFDFDSTLSETPMQNLCKLYKKLGADIYVTTSRGTTHLEGQPIHNSDLFEVTDKLGINRENIIFTQYQDKYRFVKDFDIHYDDDFEEIYLINQNPNKCIGFLYEKYHAEANGIINY